jgi:hypothetical protein
MDSTVAEDAEIEHRLLQGSHESQRAHYARLPYCTEYISFATCRIYIEDDGNAVVPRSKELVGGKPHHGEEGQQVGLQLHHRHPVAGISQPNAGVVANLTHIPVLRIRIRDPVPF